MLKIDAVEVGLLGTNCYIVQNDETGTCVIIDPGANADLIKRAVDASGTKPEAILLTHGHFDHIMAVPEIRAAYGGLKVYAFENERYLLENVNANGSFRLHGGVTVPDFVPLSDRQKIGLCGHVFECISTPGHTQGSCCYYVKECGILFSGDTLFYECCGRTDFETGNMEDMIISAGKTLMELPDETLVYPGHDISTDIGHERRYNPYCSMYKG